ncbi:Cytochrome b5-like Heme/Steroid binding domain protein [Aphelenchoides fujianensis]|nr:Cytochrome b5-like Heme/Steroid binding domain protein [Aphelenchoides fujianensis]
MERTFEWAEIREHNRPESLWLVFEGKARTCWKNSPLTPRLQVHDLTAYLPAHPGGVALLKWSGKDATAALRRVPAHGFLWRFIEAKLAELRIGAVGGTNR